MKQTFQNHSYRHMYYILLLVFKQAYVRNTLWKFQLKMLSGSQVIQLFLSKFHPNCQLANRLDWQKQVKFQIDITLEVVKILSLNFQGLRANFEEIWRWWGVDLPKKSLFWHGMTQLITQLYIAELGPELLKGVL